MLRFTDRKLSQLQPTDQKSGGDYPAAHTDTPVIGGWGEALIAPFPLTVSGGVQREGGGGGQIRTAINHLPELMYLLTISTTP